MMPGSPKSRFRILAATAVLAAGLAFSAATPTPAEAGVAVGVSVGVPGYWGYYGPGPCYTGYYYPAFRYYWHRPWYPAAYPGWRWRHWCRWHPYRCYWR
jgi:hypothetical protein